MQGQVEPSKRYFFVSLATDRRFSKKTKDIFCKCNKNCLLVNPAMFLKVTIFSCGPNLYTASSVSQSGCPKFFERRIKTSYNVARLLLMVPIELWRNSTAVFGAAAFCTTKIDDFRASLTLSSLTTWLTYSSKRRPLKKDQLGGTKCRYSPYIWNVQRCYSPYL